MIKMNKVYIPEIDQSISTQSESAMISNDTDTNYWELKNKLYANVKSAMANSDFENAVVNLCSIVNSHSEMAAQHPFHYPLTNSHLVFNAEGLHYDPVCEADPITYCLLEMGYNTSANAVGNFVYKNYYANPSNEYHNSFVVASLLGAIGEYDLSLNQCAKAKAWHGSSAIMNTAINTYIDYLNSAKGEK